MGTLYDYCKEKNKEYLLQEWDYELNKEFDIKTILTEVYDAMCEKGYDPTKQIAGYILSEDPVYITDWKNARGKIAHINRDELLAELINSYIGVNK